MEQALGGRVVEQSEAFTAIASNITPGGHVAGWSDAELVKAIREAGRIPVQRDTFYRPVRILDEPSATAVVATLEAGGDASAARVQDTVSAGG